MDKNPNPQFWVVNLFNGTAVGTYQTLNLQFEYYKRGFSIEEIRLLSYLAVEKNMFST